MKSLIIGQRTASVEQSWLSNDVMFCTVNLNDDRTRDCPAIDVALSLPGERVVEMLARVARTGLSSRR